MGAFVAPSEKAMKCLPLGFCDQFCRFKTFDKIEISKSFAKVLYRNNVPFLSGTIKRCKVVARGDLVQIVNEGRESQNMSGSKISPNMLCERLWRRLPVKRAEIRSKGVSVHPTDRQSQEI
jgi:hypothetical protein